MSKRTRSALAGTYSALRAFLRHTWISRVFMGDWLKGWALRPSKRRQQTSQKTKWGIGLGAEVLEFRGSPDDPFGILQSSWLGGAGTLLTPGMALLRGWAAGEAPEGQWRVEAPSPSFFPDTCAAMGPPPFGSQAAAVVGGDVGVLTNSSGLIPAAPQSPADAHAAEDPFGSALGNDWLNAVGAFLDGKSRRGGAAGGDAAGGGGSSGGGGSGGSAGSADMPGAGQSAPAATSGKSSDDLGTLAGYAGAPAGSTMPAASASTAGTSGGRNRPTASGVSAGFAGAPTAAAPAAGSQPLVPAAAGPAFSGPGGVPSYLQSYNSTALAFEPNYGQTASGVHYLAHGSGFETFLTDTGAFLSLARPGTGAPASRSPVTRDVVQLSFAGTANPTPQVFGGDNLTSFSNYYKGGDPSKWLTDVPNYGSVFYGKLYHGVDLVFHGASRKNLEFDFQVAPHADPTQIKLNWQGAQSLETNAQGDLLVHLPAGETLTQKAPVLYQLVNGARQTVTGQHLLTGPNQFGFQVGSYDSNKSLYIDPVFSWATYLGGSGDDQAYGIAVNSSGVFVTGSTSSPNFPGGIGTLQGSTDAFAAKLDLNSGSIGYWTYIGGSADETGFGIAVDSAGKAWVAGQTYSSDFPTSSGALQSSSDGQSGGSAGFVAELSGSGARLYSTYLGGTNTSLPSIINDNYDAATAIAVVDGDGIYVTGRTSDPTFPTSGNAYQPSLPGSSISAFVTKLSVSGSTVSLAYSSYLGGSSGSSPLLSEGLGIAADNQQAAYVTGDTNATNFPTTAGAVQSSLLGSQNAFVAKLDTNSGTLIYGTFLGGGGSDAGRAIAIDPPGSSTPGNIYVVGSTSSSNFPTMNAFQGMLKGAQNAFVSKLSNISSTPSTLAYSSYLGGTLTDTGYGIKVNSQGEAYLTGSTNSGSSFPTYLPFQTSGFSTSNNAFVTKLTNTGTLAYSSLLGGATTSGSTPADNWGRAVDLDVASSDNAAYVAGYTNAVNFPTGGSQVQGGYGGGANDAFVSKITSQPTPPTFTGISPDTGSSSSDQITNAGNITISGAGLANALIKLIQRGVGLIATIPVDSSGLWTCTYFNNNPLGPGGAVLSATQTAGNQTSGPSPDFPIYVDQTPPVVYVYTTSPTASTQPQVTVIAWDPGNPNGLPDGTAVGFSVYKADGTFVNSTTNAASLTGGQATFQVPWPLTNNTSYNVYATVADLAGNTQTSPPAPLTVLPVYNAPQPPRFTGISLDTGKVGDQVTSATTLYIKGTSTPNATITLWRQDLGASPLPGSATADGTGAWTYDYTGTPLSDAEYLFTAAQTVGGLQSAQTLPYRVVVDTTAPMVNLIAPASTSNPSPQVTVTAKDLDLIGLGDGTPATLMVDINRNGNFVPEDTIGLRNGNGTFTSPPLAPGYTYPMKAQVADLAGNVGTSSVVYVTVTTGGITTPLPPTFTAINPDTGWSNTDQITNNPTISMSGRGMANATVNLTRVGTGVIGNPMADSNGAWTFSYTTALPEGVTNFTATQTVSGYTSAASPKFRVVIDTTPPDVTVSAPASTSSTSPQVTVWAQDLNGLPDGTPVTFLVDINRNGLFQSSTSGTLVSGQATFNTPTLTAGYTYAMKAQVTDIAGNIGTSPVQNVQITTVTNPWLATAQVLTSDPFDGMAREQLGDVQLQHALDLDQSPGTVQSGSPALVYNSDAVSVQPIVQAQIPSANTGTFPTQVQATLTWNGVAGSLQTFSTAGDYAGDILTIAVQVPTAVTATGRYGWSLLVQIPGMPNQTVTGSAYVVTQDASPFGAGWTYGPVD